VSFFGRRARKFGTKQANGCGVCGKVSIYLPEKKTCYKCSNVYDVQQ